MNSLAHISDEEFVPFLHGLGVDTYKKSFEWMLNDADFSGVLQWLYKNLDHNNALTAREEYRYTELEKSGKILSAEDLESTINSIQDSHQGICLPGYYEAMEDAKLNISMMRERLNVLERQENVLSDLVQQNELTKEELTLEITKLNAAQLQCSEDETKAAEECQVLADEVESITEGVVDVIAEGLSVYSKALTDKDTARKFFTFGPLEAYKQSQALFRSHFDLYVSRKFQKRQKNDISDEDLKVALVEAKNLEERLTESIYAYVESKAELSGEQAKLALVTNYNNVHPSQIPVLSLETQSALDLLEHEENIMDQQIQSAIKTLVDSRTKLAIETTVKLALSVRHQINTDLNQLLDITQQALALDKLAYLALRRELRNLEEIVQFASQLKQYVKDEREAVICRMESMNDICMEQASCEQRLQTADTLVQALYSIFDAQFSQDGLPLVKLNMDLNASIKELTENIDEGYKEKERRLITYKQTLLPLHAYINDGCTKQPNCWNRSVAAIRHQLDHELAKVDAKVVEAGRMFATVKSGDKQDLRKLWQWFLTNQLKLLAVIKRAHNKTYS